jgi:hypothetical protein
MMLAGKLKPETQTLLWAETTKCASLRTNLTINTTINEPPDKMWYGRAHWENCSNKILSKMNLFGRIGYVKTKKKIEGKFVEKTRKCIHMSHAEDHPHDTYRMYNPMTRAVILTRNVTWAAWAPSDSQDTLVHLFEQNPDGIADQEDGIKDIIWADGRPAPHVIPDNETKDDLQAGRINYPDPDVEIIPAHLAGRRIGDGNGDRTTNDSDSEDDEALRIQVEEGNFPQEVNADKARTEEDQDPLIATPTTPNAISTKSRMIASAMRKLQGYYNPLAAKTLDKGIKPTVMEPEGDMMDTNEVAGVVFSVTLTSDPGEPQTFREAVDGPAKEKWLPSTKNEVLNFINRDAWKKIERTLVSKVGRKQVPLK